MNELHHQRPLTNQADEPALMVEKKQCVAYITLNRENSLNAINNEIRDTFPKVLAQLDRARDVRAIVITGSGSRAFCVGADIKELRATGSITDLRKSFRHNGWIEALDDFSKPTIAAINGYCLGGGLELALACDIRIASSNSIFGLPEVNLGLIPAAGGTQRLPRLIGLGRALDLLITGEKIQAQVAYNLGLISRLIEEGSSLAAESERLANSIADKPAAAVAYVKEAARESANLDLKAGLRLEKDLLAILFNTKDRLEAADAFISKRPARFHAE
ncbi:enoyl-CoA hydratase/isomerase family protein [Ramlibacter sp. RBP-2]|uniref:Enoyl-CoA hydratase/isomerase family protein n=1 Tax=Ramlibacter lithotrophicus TaxID=2606681 RepID=A0A7X6DKH8_9BURK|nr:enoyl-CoA hydratase/isomerase family protein [Ramlibacter lithotrophicus]NKE68852.1 enoyl-CoA hydratase/isomerase family protein [Ramlibacter lithotrophicus]